MYDMFFDTLIVRSWVVFILGLLKMLNMSQNMSQIIEKIRVYTLNILF